jgi:hydrogenase-4 component B
VILWGIGGAVALLFMGAAGALLARRSERAALALGFAFGAAACALGLGCSVAAVLGGSHLLVDFSWSLPLGSLRLGLDPLSSFFLACVFAVSGLCSLYGWSYLTHHANGRAAAAVTLFHLLVASMVAVVLARDGILFLAAWEVMSIASFFLVSFEDRDEAVRRAGMTYLIASHVGVAFLFALFVILSGDLGRFDFETFAALGPPSGLVSVCFVLAAVGFGTKAGFWPLHVWLPDAHPAAPSHVSALMSGVMIKMGIYGLLRTLTFLGPPEAWWGVVLIVLGAITGLAGVLHALAQQELKRLLAYSSVENMGIIVLATGLGVLGQSRGDAALSFLGFSAALLHTMNHGLFKGLLFQGAGAVIRSTGVRDLDALGGVSRRMPVTALTFAIGSAALCGLPPLNGFVSEWLAYVAAFRGASALPGGLAVASLVSVPVLALIAGLAAACFAKAFAIVFLGEPRTDAVDRAGESRGLCLPMILAAAACLVVGIWPHEALRLVAPAVTFLSGATPPVELFGSLRTVARVAIAVVALAGGLAVVRYLLLRKADVREGPTWACGYAAVTPRMQYTSSSFPQLLLASFEGLLDLKIRRRGPEGYFPADASFEERTGDPAGERLVLPATRRLLGVLSRVRALQQGRLQLSLAYIFATLVVFLLWRLGGNAGR